MDLDFPWMDRDDPSYDPNRIGAVTMAKVIVALVAAGKVVLTPCVQVRPYDLVIEEDNRFYRVQCKTGRMFRGAVCFRPHRLRVARKETGWQRRVTNYEGAVDFFGVYCPENDCVYLVPIGITSRRACSLRVLPSKNNQSRKIHWAKDYEVIPAEQVARALDLFSLLEENGAVAQLGERVVRNDEVRGSIPLGST